MAEDIEKRESGFRSREGQKFKKGLENFTPDKKCFYLAQFNKLVSNSLIAGDAVTDFASCVDALIDIQVENVDKSRELMMFFERRYQKRLNVSKAVLEGRITSRQAGLLYDGQYNLSVEDFRDKFGEIFVKSQ